MDDFLFNCPKDLANKIINYVILLNVAEKSNKMRYVNSELFNGYWIEDKKDKVILKTSFNYKCLGYKSFFTLGYKKYSKKFEIPKKIKEKILSPNNFLCYNDGKVSSIELKDIEYEWATRLPKLES